MLGEAEYIRRFNARLNVKINHSANFNFAFVSSDRYCIAKFY